MANEVNVITQDNWDEKLTMANPPVVDLEVNLVIPPPKKMVQINFFGEIVEDSTKTVKVKAHKRQVKKAGSKMKKIGKYDAFNGCQASKKKAAELHVKDLFDAIEARKNASKSK